MSHPYEFHDAEVLREDGISLAPYGLLDYPSARETGRLRRQLEKGIPTTSGEPLFYDEEMIGALAGMWFEPASMIPQFRAPRFKSTRAGKVATVSGLVPVTALQTNPFNPRPNTRLEIPPADASGRVAMPWAPTDRKADPQNVARMLVGVSDPEELERRVMDSERVIVAEQSNLADLISREGIEEDVLAIMVRYGAHGLHTGLAPTTVDGNSRVAISRQRMRSWIEANREEILATVKAPKAKAALARTLDQARGGLLALQQGDAVALRHLRQAIQTMVEAKSTAQLVEQRLYAVPNLFVVPVTMIIAFEPEESSSTVLDAADQMMRNVHHPGRAPKVWDQAAGNSEVRDEVVGKLLDSQQLTIGQALYLGPKYEEAIRLHGLSPEPDHRAYAAISIINGQGDPAPVARRHVAAAIGKPTADRGTRAQIITAMLSEQVRDLPLAVRRVFESTMNDILDTKMFGTAKRTPAEGNLDPDTLLVRVEQDLEEGLDFDGSGHLQELVLKGGVALAAQGYLIRAYGRLAAEAPRPYTVLERMAQSDLGRQLLADAITAWRTGTGLPGYDAESGEPLEDESQLDPETLWQLFAGAMETSSPPSDTAVDKLHQLDRILTEAFRPLLESLRAMPEVRREGVPRGEAEPVVSALGNARSALELLAFLNDQFFGSRPGGDADAEYQGQDR